MALPGKGPPWLKDPGPARISPHQTSPCWGLSALGGCRIFLSVPLWLLPASNATRNLVAPEKNQARWARRTKPATREAQTEDPGVADLTDPGPGLSRPPGFRRPTL